MKTAVMRAKLGDLLGLAAGVGTGHRVETGTEHGIRQKNSHHNYRLTLCKKQ